MVMMEVNDEKQIKAQKQREGSTAPALPTKRAPTQDLLRLYIPEMTLLEAITLLPHHTPRSFSILYLFLSLSFSHRFVFAEAEEDWLLWVIATSNYYYLSSSLLLVVVPAQSHSHLSHHHPHSARR